MPKKQQEQEPVQRTVRWAIPTKKEYSPKQTLYIELDKKDPTAVRLWIDAHDNGEKPLMIIDLQQFADTTQEVQEKQRED